MDLNELQIILLDYNDTMIECWKTNSHYDTCSERLADLEAPILVVPGNSFGFMSHGFEKALVPHFGKKIEKRIQDQIKALDFGELPVGGAIIIDTDDKNIPQIVYAPITRIPNMKILDPVDIYRAYRAAVYLATCHASGFLTLPFGGPETGILKEEWVTAMMLAAIDDVIEPPQFPKTPSDAVARNFKDYVKEESE